ncbi:MAG: NAD(+) synthase [Propionibacteriaceae bacterium]|jgi:NAD+ synthase (glutamine-hydrolysing)|nr:NAD(+) synthase [Propionibacteriaceae bacterium]
MYMDFANAYAQGFARVAARVLPVHLAQPMANVHAIAEDARALSEDGVCLVAYPELCVTGYSCDDLFLQETLLDATEDALGFLAEATQDLRPLIIVGAPLRHNARVYNCAVAIWHGEILAAVPKSYLPNYREFYERRWFAPGDDLRGDDVAHLNRLGKDVPLAPRQLIEFEAIPGLRVGIEVCEDMWVPVPPHAQLALGGATVIVNLSGSPITIGKADDRKLLARSASARCNCAYLFTAAGPGESSTDLSWDGQTFVYECGDLLGESERFHLGPSGTIVDIDVHRLNQERLRQGSQDDNLRGISQGPSPARPTETERRARESSLVTRTILIPEPNPSDQTSDPPDSGFLPTSGDIGLHRKVDRFPFVPDDPARLAQDCYEAYNIQVYGLARRMQAIGNPKLVIGVSGGLDSTHALIVCAKALDLLGRPRSDILAFTMPGFATLDETKNSALRLMEAIGATYETLDIRPAATQMLTDLGHPFANGEPTYDVTFENVQAGLRTDYLFRIANQRGGIVVGTGDLSELALGWCTYGVGDQMSHYAVNTGVPKTLIQYLIRWVISENLVGEHANDVLEKILSQEISPELVPPADGKTMQSTEEIIGPYALHDFFLYHLLRRGEKPSRIAYLAHQAWHDRDKGDWPQDWDEARTVSYNLPVIRHWLESFLKRFFANQFKRSAIPNGPKVSAGGTLSPRGDWRMPSDVSPATWLTELENVPDDWPVAIGGRLGDNGRSGD